ncbi:MAG: sugar nucleotide-binding protein [Gaiellales bacterium]
MTGATGFLGRELCGLVPEATTERVEIRDADAVYALLSRLRPEVVIHTAYRQTGEGAREIVVAGSANVAAACVVVGARLVHLSTDVVFDGRLGRLYREDDPPSPCTPYGAAKADAEQAVASVAPDALIVRTSLIVGGPGRAPSRHEQMAEDPEVTFYEDELRSPIQVGDLAAALLELATCDFGGILHVAGPDGVSRAELAELAAGHPVRHAPAPPGRPLDCRLDSGRATGLLRTRIRGVRALYAGRSRAG